VPYQGSLPTSLFEAERDPRREWLTHVEPVSGHRERVRITEIKRNSVIVDGNHPLAGQIVELDLMLISVNSSSHANKTKQQFDVGGEG
jgi:FKBP-type peptidyl-prolyl cis-trans isomerase 2